MPLQVYSTLSRKKEPFPRKPGEPVGMYVCGPTVYKPAHIGHMVGPVIFDTVKRYLAYLGYKVTWVVNITDVDDKLIARAGELKTTVPELAERMTADYLDCLKKLNVTGVDHFPKATAHIPQMVEMIGKLVETGFAYPAGGDVYFDVAKDPDYGKLCNRDPEQLEAGSRIEVSDRKHNPGDFALWKGAKPGEPAEVQFDSPWGKGRPGWHIECSAMAKAILGDTLDIHGGGLDLTFPHHENELAQSESANGVPFARVWMHNGLLKLGKDKMAGSVGNVVNVADALPHMTGDAIRFFILQTHYRSPIEMGNWSEDKTGRRLPLPDNMLAAKTAFGTFEEFARRVGRVLGTPFAGVKPPGAGSAARTMAMRYVKFQQRFNEHLDDDFNTGGAVGVLFELVTALNKLADAGKLEDPDKAQPEVRAEFADGAAVVREMCDLLGLKLEPPKTIFADAAGSAGGRSVAGGAGQPLDSQAIISGLMQLLIDLRGNLRDQAKGAAKDNPLKKGLFDQTDLIRKRLAVLGVTLEDRPGGTTGRAG
ncbi:MAG: cysteine--tRNA ligase [Gemmataceae bacterium]|nr:cysteine--tRNA ligase [Gemmataceae bacterium]